MGTRPIREVAEPPRRSPTPGPLAALPGPHLRRVDLPGLDLVDHLLTTADRYPAAVVAHADESFFAPHLGTVGCVGVSGADHIAAVLTDADDYAPLVPATSDLPDDVRILSDGVFTMHGSAHDLHRRQLRGLFTLDDGARARLAATADGVVRRWSGRRLDLVPACRAASRTVWAAVLFGTSDRDRELATMVHDVVDGRRARRTATTPIAHRAARQHTVRASRTLDAALRAWFAGGAGDGLLSGLVDAGAGSPGPRTRRPGTAKIDGPGSPSDRADRHVGVAAAHRGRTDAQLDRAVAHATAVFAAASEPAAASLAWAVLALTQRPDVAEAARDDPAVVDTLLRETQRLLPSSAIVTRATLRPVRIAGHEIPANCEVIVSSLLAQRDATTYPRPNRLDLTRWDHLTPSRFEFFPFGAGARACLGATLARVMLSRMLTTLLAAGDVVLPFDCHVGWQMPDALLPAGGIPIEIRRPGHLGGRALGDIERLVDFDGPRRAAAR